MTWETCSLRAWLNGTFADNAFSTAEKEMILTAMAAADKNPGYSTDPGSDTADKIFLLSIPEAEKYFANDSARACKPTAYAEAQGAYVADNGNAEWWLRSPGSISYNAALVYYDGSVFGNGLYVYYDGSAVRPALWINLES